jgi:hypothetical protein
MVVIVPVIVAGDVIVRNAAHRVLLGITGPECPRIPAWLGNPSFTGTA